MRWALSFGTLRLREHEDGATKTPGGREDSMRMVLARGHGKKLPGRAPARDVASDAEEVHRRRAGEGLASHSRRVPEVVPIESAAESGMWWFPR